MKRHWVQQYWVASQFTQEFSFKYCQIYRQELQHLIDGFKQSRCADVRGPQMMNPTDFSSGACTKRLAVSPRHLVNTLFKVPDIIWSIQELRNSSSSNSFKVQGDKKNIYDTSRQNLL